MTGNYLICVYNNRIPTCEYDICGNKQHQILNVIFFIILIKLQNELSWRRKWKCNLDDILLILFMSQKMQLYPENEKAFLLIHFNLNYGTDSLPSWGSVRSLFTNAAESMDSYHGNREAGTKNTFYTTSLIPPPTFSLPTGSSSHIHIVKSLPKNRLRVEWCINCDS